MLTVKGNYKGIAEWNKEAEMLVKSLEDTIQGFDRILRADKENLYVRRSGKDDVRARSAVKDSWKVAGVDKENKKADPKTVGILINKGIYNLRKSGSPSPGYLSPILCPLVELNKPTKKSKQKVGTKKMKVNISARSKTRK